MRQMLIFWLLSLLLQFTSPQTHLVWYLFALCQRIIEVKEPANLFRLAASVLLMADDNEPIVRYYQDYKYELFVAH